MRSIDKVVDIGYRLFLIGFGGFMVFRCIEHFTGGKPVTWKDAPASPANAGPTAMILVFGAGMMIWGVISLVQTIRRGPP